MSLLPSELDLAQGQLSAIGCVAIESARLDSLLERIIWMICEFRGDAGKKHTDRLETGGKLRLLVGLTIARLGDEKSRENFQRICDDIDGVLVRRNALISKCSKHRVHRAPVAGFAESREMHLEAQKPLHTDRAMIIARRLFKLHGELWNFYRLHANDFLTLPGRFA